MQFQKFESKLENPQEIGGVNVQVDEKTSAITEIKFYFWF